MVRIIDPWLASTSKEVTNKNVAGLCDVQQLPGIKRGSNRDKQRWSESFHPLSPRDRKRKPAKIFKLIRGICIFFKKNTGFMTNFLCSQRRQHKSNINIAVNKIYRAVFGAKALHQLHLNLWWYQYSSNYVTSTLYMIHLLKVLSPFLT